MRALVSGSAGFVGRHMVTALRQCGYEVYRSDPRHVDARDCSDCRAWFHSVSPDPLHFDLVVHCAALVDGRETIEHRAALLGAYNLQLDGALFEWALRAKPGRIVYFSSSAAYPTALQHAGGIRLAEQDANHLSEPDATYGWVKLTGERIATEVRNAGVPITVLRPFSGYGEDQDDCYPFPAIIGRAARHENLFDVWGDGKQVRDFIHIDDIVGATLALVDARVDGPVNLGTGVGTSMDDLAHLAMACAGYTAPIRHLESKPSGVQHRVADPRLMLRHYTPTVTLTQGVERALAKHRPTVAA